MIPYENNLKRKCPSPLQFELIVSKQEQYETIFKLREKAKALFSKTTKVFRILDEACVPSLTCDPLLDVKLLGQGLFIKNKRILTVYPKSIVGFGFLLPTNKVAYLALATYPEYLKKDEETIKVPYNGNAVWSGLIETFTRICGDCSLNCDKCVVSFFKKLIILELCKRSKTKLIFGRLVIPNLWFNWVVEIVQTVFQNLSDFHNLIFGPRLSELRYSI